MPKISHGPETLHEGDRVQVVQDNEHYLGETGKVVAVAIENDRVGVSMDAGSEYKVFTVNQLDRI